MAVVVGSSGGGGGGSGGGGSGGDGSTHRIFTEGTPAMASCGGHGEVDYT